MALAAEDTGAPDEDLIAHASEVLLLGFVDVICAAGRPFPKARIRHEAD